MFIKKHFSPVDYSDFNDLIYNIEKFQCKLYDKY